MGSCRAGRRKVGCRLAVNYQPPAGAHNTNFIVHAGYVPCAASHQCVDCFCIPLQFTDTTAANPTVHTCLAAAAAANPSAVVQCTHAGRTICALTSAGHP